MLRGQLHGHPVYLLVRQSGNKGATDKIETRQQGIDGRHVAAGSLKQIKIKLVRVPC